MFIGLISLTVISEPNILTYHYILLNQDIFIDKRKIFGITVVIKLTGLCCQMLDWYRQMMDLCFQMEFVVSSTHCHACGIHRPYDIPFQSLQNSLIGLVMYTTDPCITVKYPPMILPLVTDDAAVCSAVENGIFTLDMRVC